MKLEITIEWPARLNDTVPLQLMMSGKVVRSLGTAFAVEFSHPEFRTMSTRTETTGTNGHWDRAALKALSSTGT